MPSRGIEPEDDAVLHAKLDFLQSLDHPDVTINETWIIIGNLTNLDISKSDSDVIGLSYSHGTTFTSFKPSTTSLPIRANNSILLLPSLASVINHHLLASTRWKPSKQFYFILGFSLAIITATTNLSLGVVIVDRRSRIFGNRLRSLVMHLAALGTFQAFLTIPTFTLMQAGVPDFISGSWQKQCKVFLLAKYLIPAVYLCFLIVFVCVYHSVFMLPQHGVKKNWSTLQWLMFHITPWLITCCILIPILIFHKDDIVGQMKTKNQCIIYGRWSWFVPSVLLTDLPLILLLIANCRIMLFRNHYMDDFKIQYYILMKDDSNCFKETHGCKEDNIISKWLTFGTNLLVLITQTPNALVNSIQIVIWNLLTVKTRDSQSLETISHLFYWLQLIFFGANAIVLRVALIQLKNKLLLFEDLSSTNNPQNYDAKSIGNTESLNKTLEERGSNCILQTSV